ncbi:hypothetical protein [Allorhodopirellula heiligendammensis]|uniref:Uncharacterized protein n=1 Tax=Allorhodopirellula heiligendammensis TaxID=2714739 RepID=A0A5C6B1Q2_9BACT|nr:hypothetical protein [Allorhodopirellula heiligendammensis]TWU05409.1 hypothetical protein Poly21_56730 [Allorhodopirellula heiligendammensis]
MNQTDIESLPDFCDKVVGFYCGPNPRYSIAIISPVPEIQGARIFYTGIAAPREPVRWDSGLLTAIAWDTVSSYTVFETEAEYERLLAIPENSQPRPHTNWLSRVFRR